jgi:hypothetical protein
MSNWRDDLKEASKHLTAANEAMQRAAASRAMESDFQSKEAREDLRVILGRIETIVQDLLKDVRSSGDERE